MKKFKAGDRVWIENTDIVENVDMIRNVQMVESVEDVECDDEPNAQAIYIVGSMFLYTNKDLKHDK